MTLTPFLEWVAKQQSDCALDIGAFRGLSFEAIVIDPAYLNEVKKQNGFDKPEPHDLLLNGEPHWLTHGTPVEGSSIVGYLWGVYVLLRTGESGVLTRAMDESLAFGFIPYK